MAVASRATRTTATTPPTELQIPKRWKDRETSPERTKVWAEPSKPSKASTGRRVPVVYYLSRNGQLEQPHFMEVPLSSPEGLFLSDVINRLNLLRGKGMAAMYSWSSKRSYKNGFVWHDLAENDFICPSHGHEYVLKGSELLEAPSPSSSSSAARPLESVSFRSPKPINTPKSSDESDFPVIARRRNQSWSSIDLHEYKVYKTESNGESTPKAAADASTQTDDKRRRRRHVKERESEIRELHGDGPDEADQSQSQDPGQNQTTTELSRDEISPPPSDSSPETLETLLKADGRLIIGSSGGKEDGTDRAAGNLTGGKIRASSVLMQLISCGSLSFKDCGATYIKDQGLSLIGHHKTRLPRGAGDSSSSKQAQAGASRKIPNSAGVRLEDKEYFSGSLIETKKKEEVGVAPTLKRSSSYNADR
ncbi:protein SOSEKI 5 isoform X2 [Rhodamnia argentea]|nr:protein SOSEKI 5 isoform X2 [Rhodamnia argentea]XP_048136373.1 protein SOSEKI 5 isoform X2 [Rhodamnia argentea]